MRERPISFSGPMVRALLAGVKTQTRRAYKLRRHPDIGCEMAASELAREPLHVIERCCPYGVPGDRLWVREAFRGDVAHDHLPPSELPPAYAVRYEAEGGIRAGLGEVDGRLRPPMFMPRRLSRITLELTKVRVELLHAISEADALAEGVERHEHGFRHYGNRAVVAKDARCSYATLWDAINGPYAWNENPWVWVLAFRVVEGATS